MLLDRLEASTEVLKGLSFLVELDPFAVVLDFCEHAIGTPAKRLFDRPARLSLANQHSTCRTTHRHHHRHLIRSEKMQPRK